MISISRIEPTINAKSNLPEETVSLYKPSDAMKLRLERIQRHLDNMELVRTTPYEEFDNKTLTHVINLCAHRYNENTELQSLDPRDSWRSDVIRPLTRNKVRSIASHVASAILFPAFDAQNMNDEDDRALAQVMEDAVEWALTQDDYEEKFIDVVIDLLVYPACFVKQGYYEVKKQVKELTANGDYTKKEVVDTLLSGFRLNIVPVEDIYIANPYEANLQKQPYIAHHKIISYEDAELKYGNSPNFSYVRAGNRVCLSSEHELFFEKSLDELSSSMVEEVTYYNRNDDVEIVLVGGIPMTEDPDRPMQRVDKLYPFAVSGFERISSRFFYYRSLVMNLKGLQDEIDIMHRMVIDGTLLKMMPSYAYYGEESIDNSIMVPGAIVPMTDETSKIEPISQGLDINAGFNLLAKLEAEASESSASEFLTGMPLTKEMTKFEIIKLEENAATKLGLFGKRVAFLVRDIGRLTASCVLQHMPISEMIETQDGQTTLKLHSLLLPNKEVNGQTLPRTVEFRQDTAMLEEDLQKEQYNILSKEMSKEPQKAGKINLSRSIYYVNVNLFKRARYMAKVEPRQSGRIIDMMKRERYYDRAVQNPMSDKAELLRFIGKDYVPGEEDRFVMKQQPQVEQNQAIQQPSAESQL